MKSYRMAAALRFMRTGLKFPLRSVWYLMTRPGWLFLFAGLLSGPTILWVPEWMVNQYGASGGLNRDQYTKLVDDYRKTVAQIIAGLGGLYGLHLVWRRTRVTEHNRITDLFTKGIELLGKTEEGSPNIEVRLGGIYALERLAFDSPRDHWTILEVLSAYLRRNAPTSRISNANADPKGLRTGVHPRTDIQAVMSVLGRRRTGLHRERGQLDLSRCDLRGALLANGDFDFANFHESNLSEANFEGANLFFAGLAGTDLTHSYLRAAKMHQAVLDGAKLMNADMQKARLEAAYLNGADLRKAELGFARLEGAWLQHVRLDGASLVGAHLEGADLSGAHLEGANLLTTHLEGARITPGQVKSAKNWEKAHYDDEFRKKLEASGDAGLSASPEA